MFVYLQLDCEQVLKYGCHDPFRRQANAPSLGSRRAYNGTQTPRQEGGWATRHDQMKAFIGFAIPLSAALCFVCCAIIT